MATVLVVNAAARSFALRVEDVIETLRPLPIDALHGMPAFLLGLSVIRGVPTPVVNLAGLVGDDDGSGAGRFVTVRCGDRVAALAVDSVQGTSQLAATEMQALPPLLSDLSQSAIDRLAMLDHQLLTVLSTARLLSDPQWQGVEQAISSR